MKLTWIVAYGVVLLMISNDGFTQRKSRFRSGYENRSYPQSKRQGSTASSPSGDTHIVKEDGKNVLYQKKTTVDFDDAVIKGDLQNPGEFYFVHRPQEKFDGLLKKRPNFHPEMLRDTVMMR